MIVLLTLVHILICIFLVIVVLLQSGKAADLAGAFGGMGSQTAFGPRGSATILSKATTIAAAMFMVTSLTLAIVATRRGSGQAKTVLEGQPAKQQQTTAPAPAGTPPGAPSITLTPEGGGPSKTIPLTLPPKPGAPGAPAQPNQQAPAQGQPPAAPAKK
jgi:preprotein translocase subunit SecG